MRFVPIVWVQIAKGNETLNLSDAQLDSEIDQPIASPLPEAPHALCRRLCITRNIRAHIWLGPMRGPAIADRRLMNTRGEPPPLASEARLRQRQRISAVMAHGL